MHMLHGVLYGKISPLELRVIRSIVASNVPPHVLLLKQVDECLLPLQHSFVVREVATDHGFTASNESAERFCVVWPTLDQLDLRGVLEKERQLAVIATPPSELDIWGFQKLFSS